MQATGARLLRSVAEFRESVRRPGAELVNICGGEMVFSRREDHRGASSGGTA